MRNNRDISLDPLEKPASSSATDGHHSLALELTRVGKTVQAGGQPLTLLKAVSLQVEAGTSLAIVGTSGSGKSTLLGIMAGLDLPSAGELSLLGHRLDQLDEDQRAAVRAQGVSFVFQNFQLLPGLTALENVMLPLEIRQQTKPQREAKSLLDSVGLGHRISHYPSQLSGGEQQRVALARAFAGQPDILFADEPTGNLDRATGKQIEDLLFQMNADYGTTLVLVTHDPQLAQRCQRQVRMTDGQLQDVTVAEASA
ncbi:MULTISPECIES: ABC transporter ATP-binding protein [unclassified Oceanobacter]|jgi:putative ABC transport system ATP-binding protein|uniref:ABC transporter ATP-binding protein n=2 Tax=Gammaproteobacteria TaxID=1236 RepID=UPI0026E43B9B|nr:MULTISPECIES: ABC transporter ATP-binding protein [unclassified Oceanobacter]MDO6681278.1 ABC transporter ATP-binding protein [Oceanobacter sp. 5_MG-2023]MDP2504988.1 ABC transporter ATP-binding protein [Oceanobacter sp. 3_MG-2023]MDP2548582.1 ABC transporter ATP-binding protein [Oceanobacter sp. 4_MG-2023]